MQNLEIEYKYKVQNTTLAEFKSFCEEALTNPSFKQIFGSDDFYKNKRNKNCFFRYRQNEREKQLTYKCKTTKSDSYIRVENNLDLDINVSGNHVDTFVNSLGFELRNRIYKQCYIYATQDHTSVFYIVYNEDMEELGRFIEIEVSEKFTEEYTKEECMERLEYWEEKYGVLSDVNERSRVKLSLFEMFR